MDIQTTKMIGFAVAGGHSRRMGGRDKALLPWGESTLLDHTLDRLRAVCTEVRILSGSTPRYLDRGVTVVLDHVREIGPLGGIEAALASPGATAGLFLAVDMPFVTVDVLGRLVELADEADAVVPVLTGGAQPLCAVYKASCLPAIRACLKAADYRMTGFWPQVQVRQVGDEELAPLGSPAAVFDNVNTPGDYDRAGAR